METKCDECKVADPYRKYCKYCDGNFCKKCSVTHGRPHICNGCNREWCLEMMEEINAISGNWCFRCQVLRETKKIRDVMAVTNSEENEQSYDEILRCVNDIERRVAM